MATLATPLVAKHKTARTSPLIGEFVGLAGAGKTTLLHDLARRDAQVRVVTDLEIRNWQHSPIFVRHAPTLLSLWLQRRKAHGRFTWDDMKAMIYLEEWPQALASAARAAKASGITILLNHGPIFKLATLDAFGPPLLKGKRFEAWWTQRIEAWALTLDFVVWLHAPESVLIGRINTRQQRHAVKGKSELEAQQFLNCYRQAYEQVLAKLVANGGPTVLEFDSSRASVEQIVHEVQCAWKATREGR